MVQLLLTTKLYFPPARANLDPRRRLVEQLNASDLLFPLAKLRARGQVAELRADDLRFTCKEANTERSGCRCR